MARIRLYSQCLSREEREALLLLLQDAGYEAELDDGDAEEQGDGPEKNILIVLLSDECNRAPELEKAALRATRGGSRLIGIWPKGVTMGRIPAAVEKYGTDVVVWDAARIRAVLKGTPPEWQTPRGEPRQEPVTRRNRC